MTLLLIMGLEPTKQDIPPTSAPEFSLMMLALIVGLDKLQPIPTAEFPLITLALIIGWELPPQNIPPPKPPEFPLMMLALMVGLEPKQ